MLTRTSLQADLQAISELLVAQKMAHHKLSWFLPRLVTRDPFELDWSPPSCTQDGNHDLNGIREAIANAKAETGRPSLIKVSTLIGYGSPNRAGTHDVHGAALGKDETAATREALQWNHAPFEIPEEAYKALSHVEKVPPLLPRILEK